MLECLICSNKFKLHSQYAGRRIYCYECSPIDVPLSERVSITRRAMKRALIKMGGGKCSICGYNKCEAALEFHHINPQEKEIEVGSAYKSAEGWLKVKKEIEKCILVCANCHRELHSK